MTPSTDRTWASTDWTSPRARAALAVMSSVLVVVLLCVLLQTLQHLAWHHAGPAPAPAPVAVSTS